MSTSYYLKIKGLEDDRHLMIGTWSTYLGGSWAWNCSHIEWGNLCAQHAIDNSISFHDEYGKDVSWDELYERITKKAIIIESEYVGRLV